MVCRYCKAIDGDEAYCPHNPNSPASKHNLKINHLDKLPTEIRLNVLAALPLRDVINQRLVDRAHKVLADDEINRRHRKVFGPTDKTMEYKIRDLRLQELIDTKLRPDELMQMRALHLDVREYFSHFCHHGDMQDALSVDEWEGWDWNLAPRLKASLDRLRLRLVHAHPRKEREINGWYNAHIRKLAALCVASGVPNCVFRESDLLPALPASDRELCELISRVVREDKVKNRTGLIHFWGHHRQLSHMITNPAMIGSMLTTGYSVADTVDGIIDQTVFETSMCLLGDIKESYKKYMLSDVDQKNISAVVKRYLSAHPAGLREPRRVRRNGQQQQQQ